MSRFRWTAYKGVEIRIDPYQDGTPLCYFTLDGADYGDLTLAEAHEIIDLHYRPEPQEAGPWAD
jgi:hypothetical protein